MAAHLPPALGGMGMGQEGTPRAAISQSTMPREAGFVVGEHDVGEPIAHYADLTGREVSEFRWSAATSEH